MVIPRPECLEYAPGDPLHDPACFFEAMNGPVDLAYGPNGHLYVSGERTRRSMPSEPPLYYYAGGAIHEFAPVTFEQIQCFGGQEEGVWPPSPERIMQGAGIEFKPLPGDFGGPGAAFQGDWVVDENDLARFASALDGSSSALMTAANLLSFDQDRDNDVDCDDWPAFRAAFLASSGYLPELPLPDIPDFVAALLGESDRPCFADRNGDGAADGLDIEPYISEMLGG